MSIFAGGEKKITITGTDGEKIGVTLRKMSQGDVMGRFEHANDPGALFAYDIVRSVVAWDVDPPVTEDIVARMDVDVVEQLHAAIRAANPSIWPDADPFVTSDGDD